MDFGDLTADELALRESICSDSDPASVQALALEAIRVFRRLATLDRVLSGDVETWISIIEWREGKIRLEINSVLAESARQAGVFRQLLAEIRRWRGEDGPGAAGADDDTEGLGDDE